MGEFTLDECVEKGQSSAWVPFYKDGNRMGVIELWATFERKEAEKGAQKQEQKEQVNTIWMINYS